VSRVPRTVLSIANRGLPAICYRPRIRSDKKSAGLDLESRRAGEGIGVRFQKPQPGGKFPRRVRRPRVPPSPRPPLRHTATALVTVVALAALLVAVAWASYGVGMRAPAWPRTDGWECCSRARTQALSCSCCRRTPDWARSCGRRRGLRIRRRSGRPRRSLFGRAKLSQKRPRRSLVRAAMALRGISRQLPSG
jgi:hypothetical protein